MEKLKITSDRIKQALDFATEAHKGVFRKSGDNRPYVSHPIQVATLIQEYHPENENAIIGALLHDTVEDCENINFKVIEDTFGEDIKNIVRDITDDESDLQNLPKDELKKVRRQRQVDNLKNICSEARIIRLGDKISNTVDITEVNDLAWQIGYTKFIRACYQELKDIKSPLVNILDEKITSVEKQIGIS